MKLNVRIPVSSCNEETVTRLDMVYELPHQATVTDEDLYNVASMSLLLLRENLVRNTVEKRQTPRKDGHHLSSLTHLVVFENGLFQDSELLCQFIFNEPILQHY